jgi:hypothetical protein
LPATIHCPLDHLRMSFHDASGVYRCNLPECPIAYAPDRGYYRLDEQGDDAAQEELYALAALATCQNDPLHRPYIEDFVARRRVRFWVCPARGCDFEASQRLEKTPDGWRTCGAFERKRAAGT